MKEPTKGIFVTSLARVPVNAAPDDSVALRRVLACLVWMVLVSMSGTRSAKGTFFGPSRTGFLFSKREDGISPSKRELQMRWGNGI